MACSMAAAGLVAAMGGKLQTGGKRRRNRHGTQSGADCDPIGGLNCRFSVERNAMGAIKAVNSADSHERRRVRLVPLDDMVDHVGHRPRHE